MRRKIATVIAASLLVSSVAGCSKSDESNVTSDPQVSSESSVGTSAPAEVNVNIYGDAVFTKEDIEAKINSGLSNDWQDYQLEAMFDQVYGFPDNVKETLKNYYGAYAWTKMADDFPAGKQNYEDYSNNKRSQEDLQFMHALMDLYGIRPTGMGQVIGHDKLLELVDQNPELDLSQYHTYDDGNIFLPYFESCGSRVYAETEGVIFEAADDIHIVDCERIARTIRITNTSDKKVLLSDIPYEEVDWNSVEDYDPERDRSIEMMETENVIHMAPKAILEPGEVTYTRLDCTNYRNVDICSAYRVNVFDDEGNLGANNDVAFILKNYSVHTEDYEFEYATIRGTLYNTDGEPIPFMPVEVYDNVRGYFYVMTGPDGSFTVRVPVFQYQTDLTYARYNFYVDGGRTFIDGKPVTAIIGNMIEIDHEMSDQTYEEVMAAYGRHYGTTSVLVQPTEADKEYEIAILVPDSYDFLQYDLTSEQDLGGQTYGVDYANGKFATVKYHDQTASGVPLLNVFDTDGNILLQYPLGSENPAVDISDDGTWVAISVDDGNGQVATIVDLEGNIIYEHHAHSFLRGIQMSHDKSMIAFEDEEGYLSVFKRETDELLWSAYMGPQVRFILFSEDNSVVYASSEAITAAYSVKDGTKLWETYIGGFAFDLLMNETYLYTCAKTTGGNDEYVFCIDRTTGKQVWTYQVGSRCCRMQLSPDGTMIAWGNDTGSRDINGYILDAHTGRPLWATAGIQAAWFTSDSQYVALKCYSYLEIRDRYGNRVATDAVGSNSKMSYCVYVSDDLTTVLDVGGSGNEANSGYLFTFRLKDGYSKPQIQERDDWS